MENSSIVSNAAVDAITAKVWSKEDHTWMPDKFIKSNPGGQAGLSNQNVDTEHFCAPVIHPVMGETITQYKTLANNPVTSAT